MKHNVIRFVFAVWLTFVTARFGNTIIKSVANPFNAGMDWWWCGVWILLCALALSATMAMRRSSKKRVWLMPVVPAVAMLYLSGTFVSALVAVWLFLLCVSIGVFVLQNTIGKDHAAMEYVVCGVPLGTGFISMGVLALGLTRHLTVMALAGFLGALTLASIIWWRRNISLKFRTAVTARVAEDNLVYSLMSATGLVYLLWAVAPEIQFDALNYHLAVPAKYLEHSAIVDLRFFHAYFARTIELFLAACLALGGPAAAKIWIFLMSAAAVAGVYALGRCSFDQRVGLWAAALFMTTPVVGWLFGTAYIDNVMALFVTASFIALVKWEDSRNKRWLYVTALLAGIAAGSKLSALLAYVFVAPVVTFGLRRHLPTLAIATAAFLLAAMPTFVLVYGFTGNPVFPLMNGVFESPKWNLDNSIMNAADYGIPVNFSSFIRFPFRLTFDTDRFGEGIPRGALGLTLLFAFPFAGLLWPESRKARRLLMIAAAGFVVLLFLTMQYARYYVTMLPVLAVLGVATVFYVFPTGASRIATASVLAVVVIQPFVLSLQFWSIPDRFPAALAAGLENNESFLRRALPGYSAVVYVNSVAADGDRILGLGTENLRFYLRPELQTAPLALYDDPVRLLAGIRSDKDLASAMKGLRFRYLLVLKAALESPSESFPYLQRTFLESHAEKVFEEGQVVVFRLRL